MALSLIQFDYYDQDIRFYGVLKPGVTQDQIFSILQTKPGSYNTVCKPLIDLLDPEYSFSDYADFVYLSQSEDTGFEYYVNYDLNVCSVKTINNGLGGIVEDDRDNSNSSTIEYFIPNYKVSSALFASADFMPGEFLTGVVSPMLKFASTNAVILCLLAVTFMTLGVRILRRIVGSLGRGR